MEGSREKGEGTFGLANFVADDKFHDCGVQGQGEEGGWCWRVRLVMRVWEVFFGVVKACGT